MTKDAWPYLFFSFFSPSIKMQLFLRGQNTHTLEVTGEETVGQIKVKLVPV